MSSSLARAFRDDLGFDEGTATLLAGLALKQVPRFQGSAEDSEEDVILRLRDPRVFGLFAESVGRDRRVPFAIRTALAEHVFDLLSLARTEGDVIAVEARAPRRLLALAAFLLQGEGLSVLHVMHLVYAVFLDRSLVTAVPVRLRSAVLRGVVREAGSGERVRALYACLHLAAIPEREAVSELASVLRDAAVPVSLRSTLASVAASGDGGRAAMVQLAVKEGLLPDDVQDPQAPSILANIPRLPGRLAPLGSRFLEQQGSE